MSAHAAYIVLLAALLHASWNGIVKSGSDKLLSTVMITSVAGSIAALTLPFLRAPAAASWPFIAGSVSLQTLYYALLAASYRTADMSFAYPIMRGTAPLLVAALSAWLIGETVSQAQWLGIALICGGVLGLAVHAPAHSSRHPNATAFALGTACVIASYTVIDGLGVRHSGAPVAYTLWIFLLTGFEMLLWILIRRRREYFAYLRGKWPSALAGGCGTLVSYVLALWAMTVAPVAALRETSILFATVISALVLKERVTRQRLACIA